MVVSLLELTSVTKIYRSGSRLWRNERVLKAVDQVSFTMEEGECLGIVGESGSGKSTLGKLILGMEKPDAGQILFQGSDLQRAANKQKRLLRKDLQVVFQNSFDSLNPRMSAGQIIGEPLSNYERLSAKEMQRRVEQLLDAVGMRQEDQYKFPHQFSGGQQQRINIARALALQPRLIVLDEAISSLDMVIQAQILKLFIELKKQFRLSYLFISHDIQATCHISDRLLVFDQGRLVEKLEQVEQLQLLKHPASLRLLDAQLPDHPRDGIRRRFSKQEEQLFFV